MMHTKRRAARGDDLLAGKGAAAALYEVPGWSASSAPST